MGGGFVVLPRGNYPFEVVDTKWKQAKTSKAWMIDLKTKANGGDAGEVNVWEFLIFGEKTIWKFDQFLKSIDKHPGEGVDIDIEEEDGVPVLRINGEVWEIDDLIGQKGHYDLKVGKNDKGEDRNEVASFTWEEF